MSSLLAIILVQALQRYNAHTVVLRLSHHHHHCYHHRRHRRHRRHWCHYRHCRHCRHYRHHHGSRWQLQLTAHVVLVPGWSRVPVSSSGKYFSLWEGGEFSTIICCPLSLSHNLLGAGAVVSSRVLTPCRYCLKVLNKRSIWRWIGIEFAHTCE